MSVIEILLMLLGGGVLAVVAAAVLVFIGLSLGGGWDYSNEGPSLQARLAEVTHRVDSLSRQLPKKKGAKK